LEEGWGLIGIAMRGVHTIAKQIMGFNILDIGICVGDLFLGEAFQGSS